MKLLDSLIKFLPSKSVYAHCDIPCGLLGKSSDAYFAEI